MSKVTNRIKRYAIKNFDLHLDQTLHLAIQKQTPLDRTQIHQDIDIYQKDVPINFQIYSKNQSNNQKLTSKQIIQKQPQKLIIYQTGNFTQKINSSSNILQITKNNKKQKTKQKNFIELKDLNKNEGQKNMIDQRIQRMRKNKLQSQQKQLKRSLFYSVNNQASTKKKIIQSSHYKKNDQSERRDKKNDGGYYIPIGYNGQRLQKKVSKQSELAKYNNHFVDMQITVTAGEVCVQNETKQNHNKKQNFNYNIFQKLRQKKVNQILNSKNVHVAVFRTNPKKINQEQRKQQFQRKLEGFVNKTENKRVQVTLRQLMQFKQIIYRKRQDEYFRGLKQVEANQKLQRDVCSITTKKITMTNLKQNAVKKQEVNIQNKRNYQELLSAAQFYQDLSINNYQQKSFTANNRKIRKNNSTFHIRNKTTRNNTFYKDYPIDL